MWRLSLEDALPNIGNIQKRFQPKEYKICHGGLLVPSKYLALKFHYCVTSKAPTVLKIEKAIAEMLRIKDFEPLSGRGFAIQSDETLNIARWPVPNPESPDEAYLPRTKLYITPPSKNGTFS